MASLSSILSSTFQGDTGPQGPQGDQGPAGAAATIAVGTVSTGDPGTNVNIVNTGTSAEAIFSFTIPKGADGADGAGLTTNEAVALAIALG
jgi:hypothetical protein